MIITIPTDDNSLETEVCMSFGRAPYFYVYNTASEKGEFIVNDAAISPGGAGVKAAQIVVDHQTDVLITPRCGENAADVFKAAKVQIFKSAVGSAMENISAYNNDKLGTLDKFHAGFHGIGGQ